MCGNYVLVLCFWNSTFFKEAVEELTVSWKYFCEKKNEKKKKNGIMKQISRTLDTVKSEGWVSVQFFLLLSVLEIFHSEII